MFFKSLQNIVAYFKNGFYSLNVSVLMIMFIVKKCLIAFKTLKIFIYDV